jgi:hypothetical protein
VSNIGSQISKLLDDNVRNGHVEDVLLLALTGATWVVHTTPAMMHYWASTAKIAPAINEARRAAHITYRLAFRMTRECGLDHRTDTTVLANVMATNALIVPSPN